MGKTIIDGKYVQETRPLNRVDISEHNVSTMAKKSETLEALEILLGIDDSVATIGMEAPSLKERAIAFRKRIERLEMEVEHGSEQTAGTGIASSPDGNNGESQE